MAFKVVISDPKSRKAYQKEAEENASGLIGKKVGDKVSGGLLGLEGYELEITGGSDRQGFPMRPDVEGQVRKRILLAFPPGFHPVRQGERERKSVRGNTISREISQINLKVVKEGKKPIETLLGVKPKEEKPEEKKAKEEAKPKEAPKEEKKPEEKPKEERGGEKPEKPAEEKKPEEKMGVKTLEEKEEEIAKEERKEKPAKGEKAEK